VGALDAAGPPLQPGLAARCAQLLAAVQLLVSEGRRTPASLQQTARHFPPSAPSPLPPAGRSLASKSGNYSGKQAVGAVSGAMSGVMSRLFGRGSASTAPDAASDAASAAASGGATVNLAGGGGASTRFAGRGALPQAVGEAVEGRRSGGSWDEADDDGGAPLQMARRAPYAGAGCLLLSARARLLTTLRQRRRAALPGVRDAQVAAAGAAAASGAPVGPLVAFADAADAGVGGPWRRGGAGGAWSVQYGTSASGRCERDEEEDEYSWQELYETLRAIGGQQGGAAGGDAAPRWAPAQQGQGVRG